MPESVPRIGDDVGVWDCIWPGDEAATMKIAAAKISIPAARLRAVARE